MSHVRLARRRAFQTLNPRGQCLSPQGPTHHFEFEAYVEGPKDPDSGMVINISDLDGLLKEAVDPLDGQANLESSGDLARKIFDRVELALRAKNLELVKVRLFENPDLWFDVWA